MSETKFTPGPLAVEFEDAVMIRDASGGVTAILGKLSGRGEGPLRSPGEVAANARLYAAAPDLYAALERALNFIENAEVELDATLASGEVARAALAKARGEGP